MKRTLSILVCSILSVVPVVSFAAAGDSFRSAVGGLVSIISKDVIPIMIGVAIVIFFTNLVRYIASASNEAEHAKFKGYLTWSLVALFVMFCVYGITAIISNSIFGGTSVVIPQLPTQ